MPEHNGCSRLLHEHEDRDVRADLEADRLAGHCPASELTIDRFEACVTESERVIRERAA